MIQFVVRSGLKSVEFGLFKGYVRNSFIIDNPLKNIKIIFLSSKKLFLFSKHLNICISLSTIAAAIIGDKVRDVLMFMNRNLKIEIV